MKLEFSKPIFGGGGKTIRAVGAELFHADIGADMTKQTVALSNSTNAFKKYSEYRTACIIWAEKWSEDGPSS